MRVNIPNKNITQQAHGVLTPMSWKENTHKKHSPNFTFTNNIIIVDSYINYNRIYCTEIVKTLRPEIIRSELDQSHDMPFMKLLWFALG